MRIYVVMQPGWDPEFDSAWSTEELALARADELDPTPDGHGVRWGLVYRMELDATPNDEDYLTSVERPGNAEALARLVRS